MAAGPLLEVRRLVKHFPITHGVLFPRVVGYNHAVDDISFTINAGETLGLVGESGCGKSTTGRLILRLLAATSGEVFFGGTNVFQLPPDAMHAMRRQMQIIFQDPYASLNPRLTVGEAISEPLRIHHICHQPHELASRVRELLEVVGLASYHAHRYPHEFSGGQRQRIGIARALAVQPKLLICDEPVSALDVSIQAQVINLLQDLQRDFGLTYLFIAHDLSVVKHISDRVAVMYLGKIVEIASRDDLFQRPHHPYTQALLSAVPLPHPRLRSERIILEGDVPSSTNPPTGCRFHTRCPFVEDICRVQAPELGLVGSAHFCACHISQELQRRSPRKPALATKDENVS